MTMLNPQGVDAWDGVPDHGFSIGRGTISPFLHPPVGCREAILLTLEFFCCLPREMLRPCETWASYRCPRWLKRPVSRLLRLGLRVVAYPFAFGNQCYRKYVRL